MVAHCGSIVLAIECKKAQNRSLLILRPVGPDNTGLVKPVTVRRGESGGISLISIEREPASHRAQFCVVSDMSGQRLLEQEARLVALAAEEVADSLPTLRIPARSVVVPVIVTTASLSTLQFQPAEVNLDTGDFNNLDPKQIEPIQWVRFHKTLTASDPNERTVLVVNAAALPDFIDKIANWQRFA